MTAVAVAVVAWVALKTVACTRSRPDQLPGEWPGEVSHAEPGESDHLRTDKL